MQSCQQSRIQESAKKGSSNSTVWFHFNLPTLLNRIIIKCMTSYPHIHPIYGLSMSQILNLFISITYDRPIYIHCVKRFVIRTYVFLGYSSSSIAGRHSSVTQINTHDAPNITEHTEKSSKTSGGGFRCFTTRPYCATIVCKKAHKSHYVQNTANVHIHVQKGTQQGTKHSVIT